MKKSLLATTALAALGAVAVATPASAKFEVSVGGFMEQWFGYSDNSNTATPQVDVMEQHSDTEVHVKFKQTLDNGITIGGLVEMEGETGTIDEQYATLDGSFGRIIIGSENTAPYLMHYATKSNGIGAEEGDGAGLWVAGSTGNLSRTNLHTAVSSDDNGISYFTPRINGIQIGASYVPEISDNDARTPAAGGGENNGFRDNSFGIAANYVQTFNDVSLVAAIGYTDGGADAGVAGQESALTAGVQLGFGGFTASFAYGEHAKDNATVADVNTFGASIAYNAGPAGVSLLYLRGEDSDANDKQDQIEVGASYAVGPGVTAKTSIYYIERVSNGTTLADGVAVAGGLALNF